MVKPADFSGRWRGTCVAAGLLLGMTAASPAWAEAAAMSDNPAGETPAVSVGLVAAESDLGSTQTGQGPEVGAQSTFDASGQNDIFQMAGDANPAATPEGLGDTYVGSSFDAAGNQIAAPEVSIEVGPTGTPAGSLGEVGADFAAPGSADIAPAHDNPASGNAVVSPVNVMVPGNMSVDSNASATPTDGGGSSDSSAVSADGDSATGAAPADGDATVVPPAGSDAASGGVNPVPSGGSDASGDAAAPDGDNAAGDGSGDFDNEQVGSPIVPAHEAVLSQNPYGMFDVSLSFKAEYSSRTLFGKTTTDYTKGGRISCKLNKWVQGSGLYGEPADFKYTKTDASGQTVAFDGAPEAVVSEDGTLVWTVGGLDPRDSATLEAGTTYTPSGYSRATWPILISPLPTLRSPTTITRCSLLQHWSTCRCRRRQGWRALDSMA